MAKTSARTDPREPFPNETEEGYNKRMASLDARKLSSAPSPVAPPLSDEAASAAINDTTIILSEFQQELTQIEHWLAARGLLEGTILQRLALLEETLVAELPVETSGETLDYILDTAGVPDRSAEGPLGTEDRVLALTNQASLSRIALEKLRLELMGFVRQLQRDKQSHLAAELQQIIKESLTGATVVVVSQDS